MLKVVLDTNVIISGTIMDHGATFQILKSLERGDFFIITSEPILREIEKVLHYPRIKKKRHLTEMESWRREEGGGTRGQGDKGTRGRGEEGWRIRG